MTNKNGNISDTITISNYDVTLDYDLSDYTADTIDISNITTSTVDLDGGVSITLDNTHWTDGITWEPVEFEDQMPTVAKVEDMCNDYPA